MYGNIAAGIFRAPPHHYYSFHNFQNMSVGYPPITIHIRFFQTLSSGSGLLTSTGQTDENTLMGLLLKRIGPNKAQYWYAASQERCHETHCC
jgi:hypothetical protein